MINYRAMLAAVMAACVTAPFVAAQSPLEIGMPESMFPGVPKSWRSAVADPFVKLLKENTGLAGRINYLAHAEDVAKQIDDGKVHLGILYGHEFAWTKSKHSGLTPIAVAIPTEPLQVFCLVRNDSRATTISDLRNQKLSLPPIQRVYCDMYLEKLKNEQMKDGYFSDTSMASTAVDAIFETLDGKSACAIVDGAVLRFFQAAYPGPSKRVKILAESEVFANPCVVVKDKTIDPKSLVKLQETLLKADQIKGTSMLLSIWRVKRFEQPTKEYEKNCQHLTESYPSPFGNQ